MEPGHSRCRRIRDHSWLGGWLNLLLPPSCPFCHALNGTDGLCEVCLRRLIHTDVLACCRCAAPLPVGDPGPAGVCPQCRAIRWAFDRVIALGTYHGSLREAVIRAKHAHEHALAHCLGRNLGEWTLQLLLDDLPDVLLPVPMHWYRLWFRGVNSASLLAEGLGRVVQRPCLERNLWRCRATRKQSMLPLAARGPNVRGAFRLRSIHSWRGMHVGIVDDTLTTGATADEIARLLRRAGARRISVFVAARTVAEWHHAAWSARQPRAAAPVNG